jgi:hypothetical protein
MPNRLRSALGALLVAQLAGAATAQEINEAVRRGTCDFNQSSIATYEGYLRTPVSVGDANALRAQINERAALFEQLAAQMGGNPDSSAPNDPRFWQITQIKADIFALTVPLGVMCDTVESVACVRAIVAQTAQVVAGGRSSSGADVAQGRRDLERLRALRDQIREATSQIISLGRSSAGSPDRAAYDNLARAVSRQRDQASAEFGTLARTFGVGCEFDYVICADRIVADVERIVAAAEGADLLGEVTDAASGASQRALDDRRRRALQERIAWYNRDSARLNCGNLRVAGTPVTAAAMAGQFAGTWYVWGVPNQPRFEISQSGNRIGWQIPALGETGNATIEGQTITGTVSGAGGARSVSGDFAVDGDAGQPARISWNDGRTFARAAPR